VVEIYRRFRGVTASITRAVNALMMEAAGISETAEVCVGGGIVFFFYFHVFFTF
jgi:hypothetical protein